MWLDLDKDWFMYCSCQADVTVNAAGDACTILVQKRGKKVWT